VTGVRALFERLRHNFWVLPAVGIAAAAVLGLVLPRWDQHLHLADAITFNGEADTARGLLQAIVGVAVSVAGISFSVIVVALVLASQQLSPRVLRSFQRDLVNQAVLAVFLGTAIYSTVVLSAIDEDASDPVPEFAITVAMILAAVSLGLFVLFLHHILRSLNASAVIRRIAAEGQQATEAPYPRAAGSNAEDLEQAERVVRERREKWIRHDVHAPRAGYLATVEAGELVELASAADALIEQRCAIGDFAVTGAPIASIWAADRPDELARRTSSAFVLNEERTVDHDVAFPIRQLADVALKGLSPGINDPTTAENAMDSVTDSLVRASLQDWGTDIRVDDAQEPRLIVRRPSFDDLVRIGFDQVRRDAADRPSFAVRLLELLADLREFGGELAARSEEIVRQAEQIRERGVEAAKTGPDREVLEDAHERVQQ
jgi:uncharacterized membrane protein